MNRKWGKLSYLESNPKSNMEDIELSKTEITIGRRKYSDVWLKIPQASTQHAIMSKSAGGRVLIKELSQHGTFVNGRRLQFKEEVELKHGDKLEFLEQETIAYIFCECRDRSGVASEFFDKYEMKDALGSGAFAIVKLCTEIESGTDYAVKIIDKRKLEKDALVAGSSRTTASLSREVQIMAELHHPHVLKSVEAFESDKKLAIVMELVRGGDLFDALPLTEADAAVVVAQMATAIWYMHSQKSPVCHRDLKPENVLVLKEEDGQLQIKISDFGVSRTTDGTMTTMCGTPLYLAPEVNNMQMQRVRTGGGGAGSNGGSERRGYSTSCDLWSIGVMLYVMLAGSSPWRDDAGPQNYTFSFTDPFWSTLEHSAEVQDLITKLLVTDPHRRLKAEDVLRHNWVRRAAARCGDCAAAAIERARQAFPVPMSSSVSSTRSSSSTQLSAKPTVEQVQLVPDVAAKATASTDSDNSAGGNGVGGNGAGGNGAGGNGAGGNGAGGNGAGGNGAGGNGAGGNDAGGNGAGGNGAGGNGVGGNGAGGNGVGGNGVGGNGAGGNGVGGNGVGGNGASGNGAGGNGAGAVASPPEALTVVVSPKRGSSSSSGSSGGSGRSSSGSAGGGVRGQKRKLSSTEAMHSPDGRPICRFGEQCYRKNPRHYTEFFHPHLMEHEENALRTGSGSPSPKQKKTKKK